MATQRKVKNISFRSKLERIAEGINYFAVSVPEKVSQDLGKRGPVPVKATINDSPEFLVSLHPVGGGRHKIRVKAEIRAAAQLSEGSRVEVSITVVDRAADFTLPRDLAEALKSEGIAAEFKAFPIGKKSHLVRWIEDAAKPETRVKRIQTIIELVHGKLEKRLDSFTKK